MTGNIVNWIKNSPTFKVLTVLIITLILLIPAYRIESLITERQGLQSKVVDEISSKWGAEQTVTGPILTIPYTVKVNPGTPNEKVNTKYLNILPENLRFDGKLDPKIKQRSIYKAILYSADIRVTGDFDLQKMKRLDIVPGAILWQKATLSFGISDPRGINGIGKITLGTHTLNVDPGLPATFNRKNGFHGNIKLDPNKDSLPFSGSFTLKGSSGFHILPLGKTTEIALSSTWKDPSFTGAFLPEKHSITDQGFTANWRVLDYNRGFNQIWDNYFPDIDNWEFGVNLIESVDVYQKTERSIKYAFLIIALTFTFFFFFEILRKLKIHPIQYTIVGFALLIFYLLLIALSEQMAFSLAFLISAGATVAIVGYYFYFISKSLKITLLFSLVFSFVYAFIYVILNAEAYSLLIGSVGLFVLVALIMHFTRHIDWYHTTEVTHEE